MNWLVKLRQKSFYITIVAAVLSLYTLITLIIQFASFRHSANLFVDWVILMFYFTIQSNLLVFIVLLLYAIGKKSKLYFKYLSFISLFNITITALVFHILLAPNMASTNYINHALHTIIPILYVLFYFLFVDEKFKTRHAWITLVYPLIFVINVYLWKEPLFGDYLDSIYNQLPGMRYIYPFLDPASYPGGIQELVLFIIGILAPIFALISFSLLFLKNLIEHRLIRNI